MTTASKLVTMRRRPRADDSPLTPELKDFIDHVIVPILVKSYLTVTETENELAVKPPRAAHFLSCTAAPGPKK